MKKIKFILLNTMIVTLVVVFIFSFIPKTEAAGYKYYQETEEFRGIWVATVYNMNVPKQTGTSESSINDWKQGYLNILDNAIKNNFNAIVFQVRPANDAFYPSKYNPWSEYMAGFGVNPGWDPLEWMLDVTHAAGLEYHAWLNPYRAGVEKMSDFLTKTDPITHAKQIVDYDEEYLENFKTSYFGSKASAAGDITNPIKKTGDELYSEIQLGTEGMFVLNPALESTITHINNTVTELVENYDIDGLHFDDYFYPDNTQYGGTNAAYKGKYYSTEPYYDNLDYNRYQNAGGTLKVDDWRRDNVDKLIKTLSDSIRGLNVDKKIKCAFGISPAARWAPTIESCPVGSERPAEGGMMGGCNNYYSYSDLYANTKKWALEEWIDYLVPQCYVSLKDGYNYIVSWWSDVLKNSKTKLYIGTGTYKTADWNDKLEIYNQIKNNQEKKHNINGYVVFSYDSLIEGSAANATNIVTKALWKNATLTPLYDHYEYTSKLKSNATFLSAIRNNDTQIEVKISNEEYAKAYALYKIPNGTEIKLTDEYRILMNRYSDTIFTFDYDENYTYVLGTYDNTNQLFKEYDVLEITDIKDKAKPVITSISKVNDEVLFGEKVSVKVSIKDDDTSELSYVVKFAEDGKNFRYNVANGVATNEFTFTWEAFSIEVTGGKFMITISDDANTTEGYTNAFNVVEKYTQVDPDPDPEPDPKPGNGCKRCVSSYIFSTISLLSLAIFYIRRGLK